MPKVSEPAPNPPVVEAPSLQTPYIAETLPAKETIPPQETQIVEAPPVQEATQATASFREDETLAATLASLDPRHFVWKKRLPPEQASEMPEKPMVPEFILGNGVISAEAMSAFLLATNPEAEKEFVENLTFIYIEESAVEGINHDTAFAQMCLETGFLSFTGLVSPEQNNFCGLGATGPGEPGERFPDPRTGIRAHIQHLKAYATDIPLKQDLVDPRYYYVRFGSSPAIRGLSGTWAADLLYADKIANILERLYNFAYGI
jgi:hypothetical protein